jgi:hypothetical protein
LSAIGVGCRASLQEICHCLRRCEDDYGPAKGLNADYIAYSNTRSVKDDNDYRVRAMLFVPVLKREPLVVLWDVKEVADERKTFGARREGQFASL